MRKLAHHYTLSKIIIITEFYSELVYNEATLGIMWELS